MMVGTPLQLGLPTGDATAEGKLQNYCYGSVHLTKLLALDMTTRITVLLHRSTLTTMPVQPAGARV